MATPSGSASYQKKPGTLALASDLRNVSWTAVGATSPDLIMSIPTITNMQQTPATAAKVMLKIFEQSAGAPEAKAHVFTFASDDQGRAEAGSIRDALSKAIAALKSAQPPALAPAARNGDEKADGVSGPMTIAAAVSGGASGEADSRYDDETLLADDALQQALLKKDKQLASTFHQAMKAKPPSIMITAFNKQFWSSRVRLLRAFAVEQAQKKGEYNVLGIVKPRMEGDVFKLSLTPDQAQLILRQYPVVQKANREASQKKIDQATFWTRFFQSRLHKKLKGERILDIDKKDDLFDKYLTSQNDDLVREQKLLAAHVPHIIDLGGNEQDNSQRQGNAPDFLNRPTAAERVPIMRTLNSVSERLLSHVAPNDIDPSEPIGVDEATYNEMVLKDLAGDAESQHRLLNIKDKARFFATGKASDESGVARALDRQDPKEALTILDADLKKASKTSLAETIGVDDSDSDEEMEDGVESNSKHVGSRVSRKEATKQIFRLVKERRSQVNDRLATMAEDDIAIELGVSIDIYREALLANAAAVVFLSHFWSAFHSGDPSRAGELQGVVEALEQYLKTFKELGETAETERAKKIDERKRMVRAHFERTGKKVAFDANSIKGGRAVIEHLLSSTVKPIDRAVQVYQAAMDEARREEAQA